MSKDNKEVKKVRKVSKEKIIKSCIIIGTILITLIASLIIIINYKKNKDGDKKQTTTIKVEDDILKYGYQLTDTATEYDKDLFNRLKSLISADDFDEEEYATILSQLFISDFYNLDNKITSSDIGGVQYVYKDYQDDFKSFAQEKIYDYIESNIYGQRKQELPKVTKVTVESINQKVFKYNNTSDSKAYYVTTTVSYEKDLKYPTSVDLVLIHSNDKLEVAKMD